MKTDQIINYRRLFTKILTATNSHQINSLVFFIENHLPENVFNKLHLHEKGSSFANFFLF